MIRNSLSFLFASTLLTLLLSGCGGSNTIGTCACPAGPRGAVSLSMTDDPPAGVSVLFFQVSLTNATLTPTTGSPVSLLSNNTPIQIDVTQLQALSAFLNTANVITGTYNGLSLTFANPLLVVYNQSDASLGSSCAVGSVCQLTPAFDGTSAIADVYILALSRHGQHNLAPGIPDRFPSQHRHSIRSFGESGRGQWRNRLRASGCAHPGAIRFRHRHGD